MPILGAVGQLQFEVAIERMSTEFGVEVLSDQTRWKLARRTDEESAEVITRGGLADVRTRTDGMVFALFANQFQVERLERDKPELRLDRLVG
jgi:peptide chain release factor 3